MTQIAEKLINLLTVPIKSEGYELLDVEYNKHGSNQTVQLIIDSTNGIGIDDCVAVNRIAQEVLDNENPISDSYSIEVSSPGLFRKLKTAEHYKTFTGERIRVRLQKKIQGLNNAVGKLEESTGALESVASFCQEQATLASAALENLPVNPANSLLGELVEYLTIERKA